MILDSCRDVFDPRFTLSTLRIGYDGAWKYTPAGWVHQEPAPTPELLFFGYILEDRDRGINADTSTAEYRRLNVPHETAICTGDWTITRPWSKKFGRLMPRLVGHGYTGILMHPGKTAAATWGCQLPGLTRDVVAGTVGKTQQAFDWLDARIEECVARDEAMSCRIWRDPIAWASFRP